MTVTIRVDRVGVERVLPLRRSVLRPGLPEAAACFAGDHLVSTRHYAAIQDREVVGCLTLLESSWENGAAWQLRGMATDPRFRARGVGATLLVKAVRDTEAATPGARFWCESRESAIGFYRKLGWAVVSDVFDRPPIGRHVRMLLENLPADPGDRAG